MSEGDGEGNMGGLGGIGCSLLRLVGVRKLKGYRRREASQMCWLSYKRWNNYRPLSLRQNVLRPKTLDVTNDLKQKTCCYFHSSAKKNVVGPTGELRACSCHRRDQTSESVYVCHV